MLPHCHIRIRDSFDASSDLYCEMVYKCWTESNPHAFVNLCTDFNGVPNVPTKLNRLAPFQCLGLARHIFASRSTVLPHTNSHFISSVVPCLSLHIPDSRISCSFPISLTNASQRESSTLPRHVLQPRKYVSNTIPRVRACQLIVPHSTVLTSREGGVATVWYVALCSTTPGS